MRTVVISWEELRKGEKTSDGMRWDEVKNSEGMRLVEMRWDDTDCGDRGMQWAISKRSCDAIRSDEMRKDSTFERHGIRLTIQELVAAMPHRRPVTYRHSLCSTLEAVSVSILKLPPPACPGYYLYIAIICHTVVCHNWRSAGAILCCLSKSVEDPDWRRVRIDGELLISSCHDMQRGWSCVDALRTIFRLWDLGIWSIESTPCHHGTVLELKPTACSWCICTCETKSKTWTKRYSIAMYSL